MNIVSAEFAGSFPGHKQCPKGLLPEYAFIGRSNVGKSSLINMVLNRKSIAKTSASPGKTQLINYFLVNKAWHLVDLPGYGYAKVAKTTRQQWDKMIRDYLTMRKNLRYAFVLIDCRLEPQKLDIDFINWLGINHIPFGIVFTKTDKLKEIEIKKNTATFTDRLLQEWEELPPLFHTSSKTKNGRDAMLKFIDSDLTVAAKPG